MTRDPKDLWRNQHTEGVRMSAEEVRLKAEKVRAITWRNTVIFFVLHLVAIGVCLFALLTTTFTATRLIAALAIIYIGVVWIRSRIRVRSLLTESSIDFYRHELRRQLQHFQNRIVDCFVGIVIVSLQVRWLAVSTQMHIPTLRIVLLPVLMMTVLAVYVVIRRQESRRLHREIDALEAYERN